ncbi:MAG: peptide chain release factor N(5)-glutamine methyltransferase [Candidatus Acidiferrales bacterium]
MKLVRVQNAVANQNDIDIRTALKEGMSRLRAADTPSHTLAAELLLMHTLGRDRAWMYAHVEEPLNAADSEKFFTLIARRAAGEPTQYLTGKQEFWGLEFEVAPAVLIPRPETEHVMEVALARLGERGLKIHMDIGAPREKLRVADVGTGSGCLAVALAWELPHADVYATDISAPALEIAQRNAVRHNVADRVHFLQCDLLDALQQTKAQAVGARHAVPAVGAAAPSSVSPESLFDVIVSNPPYIALEEARNLQREVRDHEPHQALFGGRTGVEIYGRLIEQARDLLRDRGILVLELGHDSAEYVRGIFDEQSGWTKVSITMDLAGIPRVLAAERAR